MGWQDFSDIPGAGKKLARLLVSPKPDSTVMFNYQPQSAQPQWNPADDALTAPTVGPVSLDPTDYIGPGTLAKAGAMAKALISSLAAKGAVAGAMGKIVYHGSPHTFDAFDMSKIGTGEGAQAYGHGLYLAEAPETAQMYRASVAPKDGPQFGLADGNPVKGIATLIAAKGEKGEELARQAYAKDVPDIDAAIKQAKDAVNASSSIYKVDIPDEAIPRMLDWDKPLSQQHPDVQAALTQHFDQAPAPFDDRLLLKRSGTLYDPSDPISTLINNHNFDAVAKEAGFPGIRYLDGGSRAAGDGTSNYVLFSDQLPRILERNGVPTGQQPWAPGEWTPQQLAKALGQ